MDVATRRNDPVRGLARKWWCGGTICFGLFMLSVGTRGSILGTPQIIQAMQLDRYRYQWVTAPSTWLMMISIFLFVPLMKVLGRRRMWILGMTAASLGTLGVGLSRSATQMTIARLLYGLELCAVITSMMQLWYSFPTRRGIALGVYVASRYGGAWLAVSLGAFLDFAPTWRTLYLVSGTGGLLAATAGYWTLPRAGYDGSKPRPAFPPFDWFSWILVWIAGASAIFLLDRGQKLGWFISPWVCLAFAVGLGALGVFLWRQHIAKHPLVNPKSVEHRTVVLSYVMFMFFSLSYWGCVWHLPSYLTLRGYSHTTIGWIILPSGLMCMASIVVSSFIAQRRYVLPWIWIGLLLMSCTTWLLASKMDMYTSKVELAVMLVFWAGALGMVPAPTMRLMFEGIGDEERGQLIGLKIVTRVVGAMFAAGIGTILVTRATTRAMVDYEQVVQRGTPAIVQADASLTQAHNERGGGDLSPWQARQTLREYVIAQAEAEGYRQAFRGQALSVLAALATALFITWRPEPGAFDDDEPLWRRSTDGAFYPEK